MLPRTRAINLMLMSTVIPAVQAVMDDLVERDVERGLQVAAYLDGQLVLDTWSGLADASTQRAVNGGTLQAGAAKVPAGIGRYNSSMADSVYIDIIGRRRGNQTRCPVP